MRRLVVGRGAGCRTLIELVVLDGLNISVFFGELRYTLSQNWIGAVLLKRVIDQSVAIVSRISRLDIQLCCRAVTVRVRR